jgi:hypothetical protein
VELGWAVVELGWAAVELGWAFVELGWDFLEWRPCPSVAEANSKVVRRQIKRRARNSFVFIFEFV